MPTVQCMSLITHLPHATRQKLQVIIKSILLSFFSKIMQGDAKIKRQRQRRESFMHFNLSVTVEQTK